MPKISLSELTGMDFSITDIRGFFWAWATEEITDYSSRGRLKNLLFYQIEGTRDYFENDTYLLSAKPGDMLFIPDGYRYRTAVTGSHKNHGIVIMFHLVDDAKELIQIHGGIRSIGTDRDGTFLRQFEEVVRALLQPQTGRLRVKKEIYALLDTAISYTLKDQSVTKDFDDIQPAIQLIEQNPAKVDSCRALAKLCCMSERTFERRFKDYSGGVPPMKYRNTVRLMMAEELMRSYTLEEVAELLGFCDAAHLCRSYAKKYGVTPKQRRISDD